MRTVIFRRLELPKFNMFKGKVRLRALAHESSSDARLGMSREQFVLPHVELSSV